MKVRSLLPLSRSLSDYQKGTEALRKNDCYCCLGVLADISGCEWVSGGERYVIESPKPHGGFTCFADYLPPELADPYGLNETLANYSDYVKHVVYFANGYGPVEHRTLQDALASINDVTNTFSQVRDFLKRIEQERIDMGYEIEG